MFEIMDGIVVINKEKGCTSHDVVYKVKKLFGVKVGHTGTLDPNATGVLPVLIGKGTELSQFLINHDKKYIATIQLGKKHDTADVEGNIIEEKDVEIDELNADKINGVLKSMIGKQKQVPPMYSAIKVNGKKLYEYARSGKTVDIPEREIEIYDLKLLDIDVMSKLIIFEIYCSKGTYVRTVCEKIAEAIGTVGYMKELQRTMVGNFKIENAITVAELEDNMKNNDYINKKIISIEKFFECNDSVVLEANQLKLFLNGVMINSEAEGLVRIYNASQQFIGIGIAINGKLKRKIILKE
ncbi:MAG: tRNA pseudouridine(55) synthase TruB [Clostridia bacterium]|nr:tRNA pseudouridine(55) synthase TruB [Clostridia bacterium]